MAEHSTEPPDGKHPAFVVRSRAPLNGGPPPELIARAEHTPAELFYVRNHGSLPSIDPASYQLTIGGLVERPLALTLADLRSQFSRVAVDATLQCAGNRRDELQAIRPIPGEVLWGAEAISSAVWAGVPLRELLLAAGVLPAAAHAAFAGLDEVERQGQRFGFGGSIAIDKALAPEVLLAYEMNGAPLPAAHGFPLRVVVPGYIGARSVKWLAAITLQAAPSSNYFQARAYKLFPPAAEAHSADWQQALMLGESSLTSVICQPAAGARLPAGLVSIEGYAYAGGGRSIARVDISADGGASWVQAELRGQPTRWAWRLWQAQIELAPGAHTLVARACDTAANTQPESAASIWNFKGYMNNAWHRVLVHAG